jgi:hypothetical protein
VDGRTPLSDFASFALFGQIVVVGTIPPTPSRYPAIGFTHIEAVAGGVGQLDNMLNDRAGTNCHCAKPSILIPNFVERDPAIVIA